LAPHRQRFTESGLTGGRVYAIALEHPTIYMLPHQIYAMPPEHIIDEDEEYESSQDSDFAPDADDAPDVASGSSDSEDGDDTKAVRKRQRPVKDASAEGEGEGNNSGDEAIIEKGRKKQKRAKAKGEAVDDKGGEGGLIKTRSQRAAEYALSSLTHYAYGKATLNMANKSIEKKNASLPQVGGP
jgi:hypothetical protein